MSYRFRKFHLLIIAPVLVVVAIAGFYLFENWRGKREWEQCKKEFATRGLNLNWDTWIPKPVPDDQNFFAAPRMAEWFVGRGLTEPTSQLNTLALPGFVRTHHTNSVPALIKVAEIKVFLDSGLATNELSGSVLNLDDPVATNRIADFLDGALGRNLDGCQGIITFVDRPLEKIKPAQLTLIAAAMPGSKTIEQLVSGRFPRNGPFDSRFIVNSFGSNSFVVSLASWSATNSGTPSIERSIYFAADYLEWSDSFQYGFKLIREAVKRPCAWIKNDYSSPQSVVLANLMVYRIFCQTLAQRTQCHLLLGHPDNALSDLTLMLDLSNTLEAKQDSKSLFLVSAMIDVPIKGLFVESVSDGLRLHAWRESELVVLQKQLAGINLLQVWKSALESEIHLHCRFLEIAQPEDNGWTVRNNPGEPPKKDPVFWYLTLAPRGWVYHNMTLIAREVQKSLDCFDRSGKVVFPRKWDAAREQTAAFKGNSNLHSYLAALAVPFVGKSMLATAHNQTRINQALIACALERFRLAHGKYPESPDDLVPQYLENLPRDLIGGGALKYRSDGNKFLLYSIGWNEKDDGGMEAPLENGRPDGANGDWVWSSSAP